MLANSLIIIRETLFLTSSVNELAQGKNSRSWLSAALQQISNQRSQGISETNHSSIRVGGSSARG